MNWSSGNLRNFVPRSETSFDVLYNYDQFPGMEQMKHMHASSSIGLLPGESIMEKNIQYGYSSSSCQERKKRLTNDQLELLEMSFQEEIKLDPDRKMKLSRELGLEPRQISVWFQNRRARWKSKKLELLYDSLKQEYDAVSREKLMLQEEVMKLKCMLREQEAIRSNKQVSTRITEASGEDSVESKSMANNKHQIAEGNYLFNVDDYNPAVSSPFSPLLPTNYYQ